MTGLKGLQEGIVNSQVWKSVFRVGIPNTNRKRVLAVLGSLILHLHPVKVRRSGVRMSYTWCMGGTSFFLFLVETVTGLLLMFYYRPTIEYAFTDIMDLREQAPFGIMREMHRWGAHAMVIAVWLHMFRVFMTGSYKPPREFNWNVGVILLVLTLLLSFTGYLLPWDQLAIWAITVGSNMARASPGAGNEGPMSSLIKLGGVPLIHAGDDARFALIGGRSIGAATLLRFYVLHCVVIPLAAGFLMAIHFWRVRKDGGISGRYEDAVVGRRSSASGRDQTETDDFQMTFLKDFINVLSAGSISFLLLSSVFGFIVFFNLMDGRVRSKAGSAFIGFGVLLLVAGIFIRPLLYLAVAYFLLMFVLANLGPRLWDGKVGLWMLILVFGGFMLSMLDPNFYLIAAKPDNVPIGAMIFLLGIFTWIALRKAYLQRQADRGRRDPVGEDGVGREALHVARPRLHRDAVHDPADDRDDRLVGRAARAARRSGESDVIAQPRQSAVVLPRPAGDARLLRSVAGRRRPADADHRRADGHPVHRHEPEGQRLLLVPRAEVGARGSSSTASSCCGRSSSSPERSCADRTGTSSDLTNIGIRTSSFLSSTSICRSWSG